MNATQNYSVAVATGTEQKERHGTFMARGAGFQSVGEAEVVGAEVWRSLPPFSLLTP